MDIPRDTGRAAGARTGATASNVIPAGSQAPAMIAKAALRRLAMSKLEPTPENYARAYAEEAGSSAPPPFPERARPLIERLVQRTGDEPAVREELAKALLQGRWDDAQRALDRGADSGVAQAQAWAALLERVARGLERGGRQWTVGRKKESLQRVLEGSRSDMQRLQQRLKQLVGGWETDSVDEAVDTGFGDLPDTPAETVDAAAPTSLVPAPPPVAPAVPAGAWQPLVRQLETTVQAALPSGEPRAQELADELAHLAGRIAADGATPELATAVEQVCQRARRLLAHRHHLLDRLVVLCQELAAGLTELSEDESWARGQCEALQARLGDAASVRGVRAATELLMQTRTRQHQLRSERDAARDALKGLIHRMLEELGALSEHTGRFHDSVGRYAEVVEQADSLESLAGAVREMVEESRTVQSLVSQTQDRLKTEHSRATELESKVRELEGELRRLSDEVSTDALTQINNRRGLQQAFEVERAKLERDGGELALGLLDIDNFKKLNDSLGHGAGDQALKALAEHVKGSLRPIDVVARYGGEEFVVVLPGTPVDEAQQVLTRLQRSLSGSLFMHEEQPVFVTFSAGVTTYRLGERIEEALERADEALYEAKRSGKNRTCIA
ncbi:GGDEF domain-containing protein [Ideonella sp. BN130291]|uniref:GGDEF domain-containing protein n=1 Tax=Ideonella sp. BN130291 TaxID=3112940 RepID=UPI002E255A11|nr:diguanylate cyclase [Ideonella sp. BN130291]